MNCTESQKWIHAYVDGELDLTKSLDIESHLAECARCKRAHENLIALRDAFREPSHAYAMPVGLESRLARTLGRTGEEEAPRPRRATVRRERIHTAAGLRWFATGVAVCAAVSLALWQMPRLHAVPPIPAATVTTQEILDSHLRSLELGHLIDVVSTDQHTVKPWFDGKISFSPPVNNLADQGFPLIGGRLDYLGSQPAAVLVYKFKKHVINVYVTMPEARPAAPQGLSITTDHGYHIQTWQSHDMVFTAVSDVNQQGMSRFVGLFQARDK